MTRKYEIMTPWGNRTVNYQPPKRYKGGSGIMVPTSPTERLSMKHKNRKGGSRTLTKKKKKKRNPKQKDSTGIGYTDATISYKKSKIARTAQKLSEPGNTYSYESTGATSLQNQQGWTEVSNGSGTDMNDLYVALNNSNLINTLRISNQLYFSGSKDEIEFMNCAPTTVEFEIYVLIDKITAASAANPSTIWDTAISQETNDVSGLVETRTSPWLRPNAYKQFNTNFWTRRYPVVLTPGEKHKFTLNFKRNRILDTSYFANYPGSIRGITHRVWVLQRGTLTDGTNAKTVTASNQSLSETKLVWLKKKTFYGSLLGNYPRVAKNIGSALGTPAGQWVIDEDTGEPENATVTTEYA